jgi:hypothetical protein
MLEETPEIKRLRDVLVTTGLDSIDRLRDMDMFYQSVEIEEIVQHFSFKREVVRIDEKCNIRMVDAPGERKSIAESSDGVRLARVEVLDRKSDPVRAARIPGELKKFRKVRFGVARLHTLRPSPRCPAAEDQNAHTNPGGSFRDTAHVSPEPAEVPARSDDRS